MPRPLIDNTPICAFRISKNTAMASPGIELPRGDLYPPSASGEPGAFSLGEESHASAVFSEHAFLFAAAGSRTGSDRRFSFRGRGAQKRQVAGLSSRMFAMLCRSLRYKYARRGAPAGRA